MSTSLKFAAIRASNPILDYCRRKEIRLRRAGAVWVGKCPIHHEKHGQSFSVKPTSGRWHCFGKRQAHGDVVDLDKLLNGGELVDAMRRLGAETLSVGGPRTERTQVTRAKLRRWAGQLRAGSSDELYNTALDRNLAVEAAELAQARGLLRYWNSHEGVAWVITDSSRVNTIGRLLNGKPWRSGNKAKSLSGSEAKRPIGLREAAPYGRIALVEGGPDFISAFHHALVNAVHETLSVICMSSSNADFKPEDLGFVAGKRSLIIQAEDDEGDVIEMAQVVAHLRLDKEQSQLVRENTHIEFVNDLSGETFLEVLDSFLAQRPVDLVWLNPYSAYLGASVQDDAANVHFLRSRLNPVLFRHRCGAIIIHHTPKTNFRDTTDWKHSDWMYAGSGAAVLTNWARAIIVVDPTTKPGVYRFIAAKRHNRIGWPTFDRYFAHSTEPGKLLWIEVASDEVKSSRAPKNCQPADLLSLIPERDPVSKDALTVQAKDVLGIGQKKCHAFANILADKGEIFLHKIPREGAKGAVGYARTKQVLEPDGGQDGQADAIRFLDSKS